MIKPVLYIHNNKNNDYRVVVNAIADWEGFEKLAKYLEINYQAEILESYDGPDARRWIFSIDGKKIELIHSDGYGNYFCSASIEGNTLISMIGKDLEKRLKDIP